MTTLGGQGKSAPLSAFSFLEPFSEDLEDEDARKGRIVLAAFLMDIDLLHPDPAEENSSVE